MRIRKIWSFPWDNSVDNPESATLFREPFRADQTRVPYVFRVRARSLLSLTPPLFVPPKDRVQEGASPRDQRLRWSEILVSLNLQCTRIPSQHTDSSSNLWYRIIRYLSTNVIGRLSLVILFHFFSKFRKIYEKCVTVFRSWRMAEGHDRCECLQRPVDCRCTPSKCPRECKTSNFIFISPFSGFNKLGFTIFKYTIFRSHGPERARVVSLS